MKAQTTKSNKKVKALQSVDIVDYFKNLHDRERGFLFSRRHSNNFTFFIPYIDVLKNLKADLKELLNKKDVNNLSSLSYFDRMIEVKGSYKLTEQDINIAYRNKLIVFQYGDIFISGKNIVDITNFKEAFIGKVTQENRVQTLRKENKIN